jgi:peptidyl-prolyl cis-trans isomerase SurA
VDLSLKTGVFSTPLGETCLQVDSFFPFRCRRAVLILWCGAILAAVAGCHHTPAAEVVATVNGKDILRADLERYYKANLADNPEQADILRLSILDHLIDDEILQQQAAKSNLVASDDEVNAKLTEMRALSTQEEFEKSLKAKNETLDDLKREIRHSLTTTKLLNKEIESKVNITDAEIGNYYAAHKADFNLIEPRYGLARIMVTGAPSPQTSNLQNNKASGDADAKKKIQTLRNQLDSGGDFSTLAMQFSEDNTASNGGDMGFVLESSLRTDPEAYNAISKLKPGQYTEILPTIDSSSHRIAGYAIYKLISREPAGQRDLNDPRVQQLIRQGLREGRAQLLRNAYFEKLHDEAKVQNYLADQILKGGASLGGVNK